MKKTLIFITFSFCFGLANINNYNQLLLNLEKQPLISDITGPNGNSFQLNLRGYQVKTDSNSNLIFGLPYLTNYSSTGHKFSKRLAYINFKYYMIRYTVPEEIKNILINIYNIKSDNWPLCLGNRVTSINFSTSVFGPIINLDKPTDNYNILYQGWLGSLPDYRYADKMKPFNTYINVGVFDPQGIEPSSQNSATFGSLKKEAIALEFPNILLPNNLNIKVNKNREIVSFWSVAQTESNDNLTSTLKKNLSINYFLLANSKKTKEWLINIFNNSQNISELYNNLKNAIPKAAWLKDKDKEVLSIWTEKVLLALNIPESSGIICS